MVSSLDRETVILGMRMIQNDFLKWIKFDDVYRGFTTWEFMQLYKNLNTLNVSQKYIEFRYSTYIIRRLRVGLIETIKVYENYRNAGK